MCKFDSVDSDGTQLMPSPATHVKICDFCKHYSADAGDSSEFYQDGTFSEGPRLPISLYYHCALEVEPGFVFISGNAYSGDKLVFRADPATGAFERLPDMSQGRYAHGCGLVNKGDS